MLQDGKLMFIDLIAESMGHPIFDLISIYSFYERANDPKAIAASPILCHFTQEEIVHMWKLCIKSYLGTDDEKFIEKAERQVKAVSLIRRLLMVIFVPGRLTPEMIGKMKQNIITYHDNDLEPICF